MRSYDSNKTTPEVRQGSSRLMNARVLIWSLLGVILAFGVIYVIFFVLAPGDPGSVTTTTNGG